MAALLEFKRQGKIRAIGVSNVTREQLEGYRKRGPVDSAQERYSILDRKLEETLLPYCRENNLAVLAYSPLANGLLTGKIGPEREFKGDDLRRKSQRFSVENRKRIAGALHRIQPIAEGHGATLAQIMLAWTIAQPGITHALVGARNPAQAKENAKAGDIELHKDELDCIEAAFQERQRA